MRAQVVRALREPNRLPREDLAPPGSLRRPEAAEEEGRWGVNLQVGGEGWGVR